MILTITLSRSQARWDSNTWAMSLRSDFSPRVTAPYVGVRCLLGNPMLINPLVELEQSYIEYIRELGSEERYPYPMDLDSSDFPAFVRTLNDYSNGINVPSHMVPNTTFWLVENQEIIGCSHLRHKLNDSLKHAGGHIGLGVRPSYRGKGVGKRLLALTIEKAHKMGITEIHIHCYQSNAASKSLIESVGATLYSTVDLEDSSEKVLRFIHACT